MARIRSVKPEFWDDEKLSKVSRPARLDYIGLWNHADDYGVCKGSALWIRNRLYPNDDEQTISVHDVESELTELVEKEFIFPFYVDGEKYFYIPNFKKHQNINRPSEKRNPSPPEELLRQITEKKGSFNEGSVSPHEKATQNHKPIPRTINHSLEQEKAAIVAEIVSYLNEKTGKKFSPKSQDTVRHISARIAEGRTVEDFKKVIDLKVAKWHGKTWQDSRDPNKTCYGDDYLRPSTLFAPKNFENYVNETPAPGKTKRIIKVLQRDGSTRDEEIEG